MAKVFSQAASRASAGLRQPPPRPSLRAGLTACAGIFFGISVLAFSSFDLHVLLALGSFGSTSILLFAFPESHFSQPRSIIGGHAISTAMGLLALTLFGKHWWALGLAVAAAAAVMMATRTVHPPAGSNPIIVFLGLPGWDFLLFPTVSGALALICAGWLYHRATRQAYPLYWVGGAAGIDAEDAVEPMPLGASLGLTDGTGKLLEPVAPE